MSLVLERIKPENFSHHRHFKAGLIPTLKSNQYRIQKGFTITGDAPKEFIRVYEYGEGCRRDSLKTWPLYIAKTARKWYPNESITEYLLNRLGACMGLHMAEARLVWINGQVRFLSRYFLKPRQEQLLHGADIYADYLNDKQFVQAIENQRQERDFITVQFTQEALVALFPEQAGTIFQQFLKLLLFDAFVGNNDRHFYNWGVIADLTGKGIPSLSPIYDTARALFWNIPEEQIQSRFRRPAELEQFLDKYVNKKSQPKISWEREPTVNHFGLMERLLSSRLIRADLVEQLFSPTNFAACYELLARDFRGLFSPERLELIKKCLQLRQNLIQSLLIRYP